MEGQDDARRVGGSFRAVLKDELPKWRAEGIVDENAECALTQRYRLDEKSPDHTAAAIYTLGALLVGGGVISFVAWNWAEIPAAIKLVVLVGAMVAAHVTGYRLWRVTGTWPRAGHALVFAGTLIYGANIGLIAQIFNIHGTWHAGVGAWALGAAVAGWALGSVPNAALAVVLATIWGAGFTHDHEKGYPVATLLVGAAFLPLAWRLRSRIVFGLTIVGTALTLGFAAEAETSNGTALFAAEFALAAALIAWPFAFREGSTGAHFSGVAKALGFIDFGVLAYVASFHQMADELTYERLASRGGHWVIAAAPLLGAAAALLVLGFVRRTASDGRSRAPSIAALCGEALIFACMAVPGSGWWVTVAGNVALAAPAILGVATAMRELDRSSFWIGTLTLGLLVVTRFFEFDTNLGVKAAAFVGAGIAVILVGVAFEKRLRAQRGTDAR